MRKTDSFDSAEESEPEIDQQNNKSEFKILCVSWNLEVIKQKGYHPKFVIVLFLILWAVIIGLILFIYGYGTNWSLFIFLPTIGSNALLISKPLFLLGKTPEYRKKIQFNIYVILLETILGICGSLTIILAVIIKTPFNNITLYFLGLYPSMIMTNILFIATNNNQEVPQWLPQRQETIYPIQQQSRTGSTYSQNKYKKQEKNDEFEIYKKILWLSFVSSTMIIDVISDIYFAADLIYSFRKQSLFLMVVGILLLLCCVLDFLLAICFLLFPKWVSYSAHLIALISEIPNFVLTGVSIWKIYQLGLASEEEEKLLQISIFSIITTCLNALIHIMYIVDRWTIQSAINYYNNVEIMS